MRDEDTDNTAELKTTVTREEMHQLVWSAPMNILAERYGVTEKTLRKICSIHLIPSPPVGYWENPTDGPRRRAKLREVDNAALHTITIAARYNPPAGDYLKTVLKEVAENRATRPPAAIGLEAGMRHEVTKPSKPQKTVSMPGFAEATEAGTVPSMSTRHKDPGVSVFMAELQKLSPDRDGFLYHKWIKVPPKQVVRVGALLHRLAERLQSDNLVFNGTTTRAGFSRDGSTVDFEITFPRKQVMVPSRYSNYSFREYRHVGRMQLHIFGWAEGSRKKFADTDTKTVEDDLDRIVESFRLNIVAEVERDEKQRENDRRSAKLARRRELASLRTKREEERLKFLRDVMDVRKELEELRAMVSALESSSIDLPEMDRMLSWARTRLGTLEAGISAESLNAALIDKKLFTEPDELDDSEGE